MTKPLLYTTRNEFDGLMQIVHGTLPEDLHGVFYVCYPAGSVNSDGLPFPRYLEGGVENKEFGTPIMNGDGLVVKVDFNQPQQATIKTRLLKTPCYYADYYSSTSYPENHDFFKFENFGISRISMVLGARNFLNTALIPFKFKNQPAPALLATYDVGRPYVVDSDSLDLVTPVGTLTDWMNAQPSFLPWPFRIVQTTAHPSFDPLTNELFTVNYKRKPNLVVSLERILFHLKNHRETFIQKFENIAEEIIGTLPIKKMIINGEEALRTIFDWVTGDKKDQSTEKFAEREEEEEAHTSLTIIRWTGEKKLKKWVVKTENNEYVHIHECMHQIGLTRDYLIVTDCSFKFGIDLMSIQVSPTNYQLDRFLRWVSSKPMEPYTTTYIIKRADLKDDVEEVIARKLDKSIPVETIHYSLNYENPDGKCTLFGVHNAATCIAEWIRPFDTNALTGKPIDPEVISLFAVGSMDITRFGKWVIDAEKGQLLEDEGKVWESKGTPDEPNIGPNTWEIALYTYRDIISSEKVVGDIKHLWYLSNGTDNRMLTQFIHDLYFDYTNRKLSVEEIKYYTSKNLAFGVTRLNCHTMLPEDYYQLPDDWYIRGIHFVPKPTPTPGVDPQLDGYLVGPVQVNMKLANGDTDRQSEIWVFDATNISKGPITRLTHPDLHYCFTLHTSWLPESNACSGIEKIDIPQEYNQLIDDFAIPDGPQIKPFFEQYVYPHFR